MEAEAKAKAGEGGCVQGRQWTGEGSSEVDGGGSRAARAGRRQRRWGWWQRGLPRTEGVWVASTHTASCYGGGAATREGGSLGRGGRDDGSEGSPEGCSGPLPAPLQRRGRALHVPGPLLGLGPEEPCRTRIFVSPPPSGDKVRPRKSLVYDL